MIIYIGSCRVTATQKVPSVIREDGTLQFNAEFLGLKIVEAY